MVKKTLLSLAIAASTAGLTACNISSTNGNNAVDTDPIDAGQPGQEAGTTAVVFSAARGNVPVAIDLLFAKAGETDGTADTADTAPPVTTAINDLAGFSATATIDLAFTAALDPKSVVAGSSVWLVEFKSKEDNQLIDSLDLTTIVSVFPTSPFSEGDDQPVPGVDYVVEYVEMDNGATPTIRVHPTKPLDPKTKYLVIVTDKLMDAKGVPVVASSEYAHVSGNDPLASAALAPVRTAVQGWEQLAGGFLTVATAAAQTQNNVILSYTFTTEGNDDILLAMAAPENYIFDLFYDTVGLEGAVGEETSDAVIAGVAAALNAGNANNPDWVVLDPTTPEGKLATRNTATYKTTLANSVAENLVIAVAGQDTVDNIKAAYPDPADYAVAIQSTAANGAGGLLKGAAHRPASRDFVAIPGLAIPHDGNGLDLKNPYAASMQGMLTLPQFMEKKSADGSSFWRSRNEDGISSVGAVIDSAFGNEPLTTPPKDADGTGNVTYRFPFAQWIEDVQVPVLVTYPTHVGCAKPFKTIIFQHGITTDRTASLGFANVMAAPNGSLASAGCFATVAIDLPTHGADASSSDRNGTAKRYAPFNTFNVAGYADGANTPFASKLAGLAGAGDTTFAGLGERHENLALDATQKPVPMSFVPGAESGNSGDMFINLTNMQQTRDHLRQAVMDMLNLNASIDAMDIDGAGSDFAAGDLDEDNIYFAGHSLGAITGLTYVAVNNAIADNTSIADKDVSSIKAAMLANPGGQLPKLLENSPSFSAKILPGLEAAAGLTQGMADLEKFFGVFQAPLDSVDPVNFTELLSSTDTPVLMFEMVGGGLVTATDSNTDENLGKVTGLPDTLIAAGGYPADTVVPNNANPALNDVPTGKSYLAGTDPLAAQLELTTVEDSIWPPGAEKLQLVSKLKEGTHGTISSADAVTIFGEMIKQTATFFGTNGTGLLVDDADRLQKPAAE